VADVRDVARRLVRSLDASLRADLVDLKQRHIVVARDLAPSETASLRRDMVIGFVTDLGSPTSHTAVMARALTIPAVVGLSDITEQVHTGDELLVDGNKGVIIVNPSDEELQEYGRLAREREAITRGLTSLQHEPAETRDGHRIVLSANIEAQDELDAVEGFGAEGVGLFRSEYLYLTQGHAVDEDTQVDAYGAVARRLAPAPVIVRTMDIGGDKILPKSHFLREANPFLGCRSIRLSLRYPEPFKAQLRAILRANTEGNVKIMYPMIGNVNEVIRANELLEEAKADVKANDPDANVDIDVGIMVEIPSAALTADVLAEHVQFFSIGTNDLIQYTLAVDRVNEGVAYLYEPTHPAVLRLIDRTSRAAHRHGIWVGVCGEMAADPLMVPLLLGLGMDEFSVAPSAVPIVKDAVRGSTLPACVDLAERALACRTGVEVLSHCRRYMRKAAPELLELI